MYVTSIPENAEFDYVIVGSGSAGCALANRLSEDGRHRVLLLEAGGRDDTYKIHVPLMVAHVLNDTRWTWQYLTEPQTHLNGQQTKWARGRVIGGSSSINGMIFVRGDPRLYDAWRDELGCTGWGYQDMLPFFKRLEDCPDGDPAVRGRGGPIHCTMLKHFDALSDAYLAACGEVGYKVGEDYNDGVNYEGAFNVQMSTRRGFRNSSAVGYLKPARNRSNLTVLPNAVATRVLLDGKRATGIEYRQGEVTRKVLRAARGRAVGGPDGIAASARVVRHRQQRDPAPARRRRRAPPAGRRREPERPPEHPAHLRMLAADHDQRCAAQPVAQVQGRPEVRIQARRPAVDLIVDRAGARAQQSARRFARHRAAPAAAVGQGPLRAHARQGPRPVSRVHDRRDAHTAAFAGLPALQSRDPLQPAKMDPRYLSHEADTQLFLDGVGLARKLSQQPSLKPLVVRETRPGPEVQDDAGLLDYVRSTVQTAWHQVGTCKMGVDPAAVVDPELRVHGIASLRVVDSSIFPTIPSTNTNIPSIATGEKGADLILAAARTQA